MYKFFQWSFVVVLLSCIGSSISLAQTLEIVSEKSPPGFDTSQLRTYLNDPDYQYQRRAPESSWLSKLWQEVVGFIERLFSDSAGMTERILMILVISGAIIVLAYFFLRSRFGNIFSRGDRRIGASMRILNEDVHGISLSARIRDALQSGDFRTAYRWSYIDLLRNLGQVGLIRVHANKTNRDYIREMSASGLQQDFLFLADAFDFTWYGEYPIDRTSFDQYSTVIDRMLHHITKA